MSNLIFDSVSFRNFLTFGAKTQTVSFEKGLNVIMGFDTDRNRSNGSGKSSLLDTIPFSLFGKTSRSINKSNLINWKNKKNCEVVLTFHRDDKKYTILRAIKPDKLEIYINDNLIPISSNVKDYQSIIENEIINYDFQTFNSLFHTNLNSIIPILQMTAPQKRAFLEKVFSLSLYSDIVVKSNEKIRSIQENIKVCNVENDFNNKMINEYTLQLENLKTKLRGIPNTEQKIKDVKEEIELLEDKYENPEKKFEILEDKESKAKNDLENLLKEEIIINGEISSLSNELKLLEKQLSMYGDIEKDISELNKYRSQLSNLTVFDKSELKTEEVTLLELTKEKDVISNNISELKINIQSISSDIKNISDQLKLLEGDKCPVCQSDLKDNKLLESLKEKYSDLKQSYDSETDKLSKSLNIQKDIVENIEKKKSLILNIKSSIKNVETIQSKINSLELSEKNLLEYNKTKQLISDKKDELTLKKSTFDKLQILIKQLKGIIKSCNDEMESLHTARKMLLSYKETLQILESRLPDDKIARADIIKSISEIENKINTLTVSSRSNLSKITKMNDLMDYIQHIKEICQDDGVKRFAISTVMPYLTSRVNHYLSESGCNFYVKLNGWLEEEIMGAGISNCTYGNLSGGEKRSIDISLQLSFIDIVRIKSGMSIDLMVFDELLDSSVDGTGITSMMRIISTLQKSINGKVFLITHRSEISDVDIDNVYVVEKNNGFSHVRKV